MVNFSGIYNLVYDLPDTNMDYHDNRKVMSVLVNNLSKSKGSYQKTQAVLEQIKRGLIDAPNDVKTFFVNLLLNESGSTFVSSMSIPLTFQEALTKTKKSIV